MATENEDGNRELRAAEILLTSVYIKTLEVCMKRFLLSSLTIVTLCWGLSAEAAPTQSMFTPREIAELNLTGEPANEDTTECEKLKPKGDSSKVGFNASPCFGQTPRVVRPNPKTSLDAAFACGKAHESWERYCQCDNKKLVHKAPSNSDNLPIGNVTLVNCSQDPNSTVDCGSFSCE
jgi:hypothetical protein